ncbi:MAG: potassium/proton antiporter [Bdellovibrio sp.]|nr:MAG: potassium/proton antiporter [Bdellovibrio sp.]
MIRGVSVGVFGASTDFENSLIIGSALVVLSVITSKASSRLGIPALLLFLLVGVGAGVHGLGGLEITSYALTQKLGTLALIFILFSGGLGTQLSSVRPVLMSGIILSTMGVLIATALIGIFAQWILNFSLLEGLLLGATIASTDVAAVFSVLRSKKVGLKDGLAPLLELESALNDPMAVFLGVTLIALVEGQEASILGVVPLFFLQMILGSLMGWGSGNAAVLVFDWVKLEFEGLYSVLSLGWVVLTYAATQSLGGSGFLAVYIAGIRLGNSQILHLKSLNNFHEGMAWLGQIGMFLSMGLIINPTGLWAIAPLGIALSAFLVFVARPASVFLCLPFSRFSIQEKLMLSWGGLRGAVPIILASYVLATQIPKAAEIFNLVFFVTFFSVFLQGTLLPRVGQWLHLEVPLVEKFHFPIQFTPSRNLKSKLIEVSVPQGAVASGKTLSDLNFPKDVVVVLIQRGDQVIVPRGDTLLMAGDTVLTWVESRSAEEVTQLLRDMSFASGER